MKASARSLLVLLAFVLPFEAPLFRLGPLQLTTVELVLYAMLAAWGAASVSELVLMSTPIGIMRAARNELRDPMVRAAMLWVAVLLLSAASAQAYRAAAFKFALRS